MRSVTAKLGTMRKAVEWTVYPRNSATSSVIIQSDHRIAEFDPATGAGWLSVHKPNGAYFMHLNKFLGATVVAVPREVIDAALAAVPLPGEEIGPGVFVG